MPKTGSDSSDAKAGTDISLWLRRHVTCWRLTEKMVKSALGGACGESPTPLGSPVCLPISLFLGKSAGFIFPLQREGIPSDRVICSILSLRMDFSACSEKLVLLSSMIGGDSGE